jgi:Galactose oxidase, central domain
MIRPRRKSHKTSCRSIQIVFLFTALLGGCVLNAVAASFAFTGSLNTARRGHTATLLQNGQVLVTGGTDANGNPFATAELYNPATGTWSVTGSMAEARSIFLAVLLPNGNVLVAGGQGSLDTCLATAELYNPSEGHWTATGSMAHARCSYTPIVVLGSAELYTP